MNILSKDLEQILIRAKDSFEVIKNKSIFITGGTGFFGKWLLETFAWANKHHALNAKITVLTRNAEKFKQNYPHLCSNVEFIAGDIKSFEFPNSKFDFIIHAASQTSSRMNTEQRDLIIENITKGTEHLLKFAKISGAKRILHTSSGAAYGKQPANLIKIPETFKNDHTPKDALCAYGEGKKASEVMGAVFSKETKIDFINARCFAFCGPYLPIDETYAIGNFIKNILTHTDITINGDGTPMRSYLYAADLITWLLKILTHGKNNEIYNVGGSNSLSIKELAEKVNTFSKNGKVIIKQKANLKIPPERYVPDVSYIKKELSLTENYTLEEMIKRTIQFNKNKL